jgi:hypothetical protein
MWGRCWLDTLLGPEETGLVAPRRVLLREGSAGAGLSVTLRVCSRHQGLWWWGFSAGTASASNVICGFPVFLGGFVGWLWCGWGGAVCFLRTAQWTRASLYR